MAIIPGPTCEHMNVQLNVGCVGCCIMWWRTLLQAVSLPPVSEVKGDKQWARVLLVFTHSDLPPELLPWRKEREHKYESFVSESERRALHSESPHTQKTFRVKGYLKFILQLYHQPLMEHSFRNKNMKTWERLSKTIKPFSHMNSWWCLNDEIWTLFDIY